MPGRGAGRAALLLLAGMAAACGAPDTGDAGATGGSTPDTTGAVVVTDATGRRIRLPAPADRVVSLVPSATLTLDALGARDVLVGRTDFDTVSWAADVPSVGGGLEPSLETLVALEPDLVIRFAGEQDPETPARLDELGVAHAAIRPDGIEDILASVRIVGELVGRASAARELTSALRTRIDSVGAAWAGAPSPRVAYILGGTPPWVAGPGTYIDQLIEVAGGINVFHDLGSLYASVSPEELVARDIDVILTHGTPHLPDRLRGRVPVVEVSDVLELPGPGVARAAAEVADLIHRPPSP